MRPGHRGTTSWAWGLIGGGRGRGLRGETPAARAQGKEGTARVNSTSGQRVDSTREEEGRGGGERREKGGRGGVGGGGESQRTREDQPSI